MPIQWPTRNHPRKSRKLAACCKKDGCWNRLQNRPSFFLSKSTFSGAMGTFFRGCKWRFSDSDGQTMWNLSFFSSSPNLNPMKKIRHSLGNFFEGSLYIYIYIFLADGVSSADFLTRFWQTRTNSPKPAANRCVCFFHLRNASKMTSTWAWWGWWWRCQWGWWLYYTVLFHTILFYTLLYYTILFYSFLFCTNY